MHGSSQRKQANRAAIWRGVLQPAFIVRSTISSSSATSDSTHGRPRPIILPRSLRPLVEASSSNKSLDHNNPLRARASCEGSKPANPRQSSQFDATPRLRAENSSHRRRVTRRFPAKAHFSNLRRFPLINDPPIHRFGYLKPGVLILRARDDLPHSDAVRYVADLSLDRRNSKRRNALRSFARHYALLLCLLYISLPDIVEHGKSGSK
jgi:hypothetical protein